MKRWNYVNKRYEEDSSMPMQDNLMNSQLDKKPFGSPGNNTFIDTSIPIDLPKQVEFDSESYYDKINRVTLEDLPYGSPGNNIFNDRQTRIRDNLAIGSCDLNDWTNRYLEQQRKLYSGEAPGYPINGSPLEALPSRQFGGMFGMAQHLNGPKPR